MCNGLNLLNCKIDKSCRNWKVDHSDPVTLYGKVIDQWIKGTPGITGWYSPRVHIDGSVWHLDVGSSHPGAWRRSQGFGCPPIKVVRELGSERRETVRSLSIVGVGNLRGAVTSTRGPWWTDLRCTSCPARGTAGYPRRDGISAESI